MNSEQNILVVKSWVSLDTIKEHLGVSRKTVMQWIQSSMLPTHRICCLWMFKISKVAKWVRDGGANDMKPKGGVPLVQA